MLGDTSIVHFHRRPRVRGLKRKKIKGGERSGKIFLTASFFDKREDESIARADGPSA
jgi:hypothetical protein